MPTADFVCDLCGDTDELDLEYVDGADRVGCGRHITDGERCTGEMHRVWTPPHLGPMSNGEPPR